MNTTTSPTMNVFVIVRKHPKRKKQRTDHPFIYIVLFFFTREEPHVTRTKTYQQEFNSYFYYLKQQHMNIKIYKFTDKKTENSHLIDLKKDYDLVD